MVKSVAIRRRIVKNIESKKMSKTEPTWSTNLKRDEDENFKDFRDRLADKRSQNHGRLLNLPQNMLEATLRKLLKDLANKTEELSDELSFRDELLTVNQMLLVEKTYLESNKLQK